MSEDLEARVITNRIAHTESLFFFLFTLQNIYFILCFVRLNFWQDIVLQFLEMLIRNGNNCKSVSGPRIEADLISRLFQLMHLLFTIP